MSDSLHEVYQSGGLSDMIEASRPLFPSSVRPKVVVRLKVAVVTKKMKFKKKCCMGNDQASNIGEAQQY